MTFTPTELEAYLDEALPVERMATIEEAARRDPQLVAALAAVHGRRDAGVHSLGEIWRRNRLSCPTRQQLGSFLLDILLEGETDYIRFHLDAIGCRYCQANLADLQSQQAAADQRAESERTRRRRRYFQSSAGLLKP
jgi:hypothetical protein